MPIRYTRILFNTYNYNWYFIANKSKILWEKYHKNKYVSFIEKILRISESAYDVGEKHSCGLNQQCKILTIVYLGDQNISI